MFFKLLTIGFILGVGAYFYDLNTAETKLRDAKFKTSETDIRCRNNHETMCQYFFTVTLMPENLEYKFRVPNSLYRQGIERQQSTRYTVRFKQKKIFPATILGLEPKYQAELDKKISIEK